MSEPRKCGAFSLEAKRNLKYSVLMIGAVPYKAHEPYPLNLGYSFLSI